MQQTALGRVLAGIRGARTCAEMASELMSFIPDRKRPLTKQHVYNWERSTVPGDAELRAYCEMAPSMAEEIISLAGLSWVVDVCSDVCDD